MSLSGVVGQLKTDLEGISSIKAVFDHAPETVNQFPAAIILHDSPVIQVDQDVGGLYQLYRLRVALLVSQPGSTSESWDDLETYMAASGGDSVRAVVNQGTRHVTAIEAVGRVTLNDRPYWGVVFLVEELNT